MSKKEADELGKAWVGEGYKEVKTKKGTILLSKDGKRQYRPPSAKQSEYTNTGVQVNYQSRDTASGTWTNNAHIDVKN